MSDIEVELSKGAKELVEKAARQFAAGNGFDLDTLSEAEFEEFIAKFKLALARRYGAQ